MAPTTSKTSDSHVKGNLSQANTRASGSARGNTQGSVKGGSSSGSNIRPSKNDDDYLPPLKAPKEMHESLVRAAESLPKDYVNVDFEVPGVGQFSAPFIPYYCFMRDREPRKEIIPMERVGYNKSGKEIEVVMNTFPVLSIPTKPVYQYEVNVISGPGVEEDRRVLRRSFNCEERKKLLPDAIYDGAKSAWSLKYIEKGVHEKFQYQHGRTRASGSQGNVYKEVLVFSMLPRRKIYLGVIHQWLQKQRPMDEYIIEALNFLDHLLRDWPTREFVAHKRAFFFQGLFEKEKTRDLHYEFHYSLGPYSGATCYRGIFQMLRPCVSGLLLNLDAAHAVFYSRISLLGTMKGVLGVGNDMELSAKLRPIIRPDGSKGPSKEFERVKAMVKSVIVYPDYEQCPFKDKSFKIQDLILGGAREFMITINDPAAGEEKRMSVEEYFKWKYNITLTLPNLALVRMTVKNVIYPAEFLCIKKLQRWPHKLTDEQTADMIKYTAKKPAERLSHIIKCKNLLQHDADPNLMHYGLKISHQMMKVKARLLPNPELEFGNATKHNPGTTARWDLRGRKFYKPNTVPLISWGVGYYTGRRNDISFDQVQNWLDQFMKIYKQHGGSINNRAITVQMKENVAEGMKELYEQTGNAWRKEPQLLIIIVQNKDAFTYLRIKKNADCRFGVPSQVLQGLRCQDNRPQYHSNVLMKVNAKLGGITNRAIPRTPKTNLRPHSVIIGADVTHPSLGVWTPSLAALCISNDTNGISYMGGAQCNGDRIEIIRESNFREILKPLLREWINTVGKKKFPPKNIYYFRDGVSESEFKGVLNREVPAIRRVAAEACGLVEYPGKICVVIANKRHHLRAFPKPSDLKTGDKNGNPLPGTLVDRDVTSPHGSDFLLYAHAALQGTARPVHYKVILDEIGHEPMEIQNMIYEQSYQYVRSTTPVSIHPAIYYSHLITARARHHEDVTVDSGPQSGATIPHERSMHKPRNTDDNYVRDRLMDIKGTVNKLPLTMWWM
ncbi:hypothetical protein N7478_003678 [Penicillium angulare]|uniref:uncharacterized protein n=1 Tax=Penicillium angulare TaxID=116970 RepID=UPI00254113F5|nr:uncharacterized protein N7478_003678 [Penicillium angulare]KAJ5287992.1 hypothetical protein N7478_003678 [Penicillium angulare]